MHKAAKDLTEETTMAHARTLIEGIEANPETTEPVADYLDGFSEHLQKIKRPGVARLIVEMRILREKHP